MQRTVLVLLVCIAVRFVCERQAAAASYKASVDVKKILRQKIYDKMLRLGPAYRDYFIREAFAAAYMQLAGTLY